MALCQMRSPGPVRSLLGALALLSLAAAPVAQADGVDSQFLNTLKAKDINFSSPQAAILAGHQVCNELDAGLQKGDVANNVSSTSNLDGYHAGFFVGLSIAAFCPRHHSA